MKLLIANRGEIAVRIMRAAAEMNIPTVAVHSEDDTRSLHVRRADEVCPLSGTGVGAYLDIEQIIAAAKKHNCTAIHPGYGFLSESAGFSHRCAAEGITFVGPSPELLELFGDKTRARELARQCNIPLLPGTSGATSLEEARDFFSSPGAGGAIMIKALAGGGGRGMRPVHELTELDRAFALCQSEAEAVFGNGEVYVERLIRQARHIEVQVIGDGSGSVSHLWERECSLQRSNQKIIEIAPSPTLTQELRDRIIEASVRLAGHINYNSLGTFEFLVDADSDKNGAGYYFMEVNPRLQVEHTVTEEVTGLDLVKMQINIAGNQSLADLGLQQSDIVPPQGYAMQLRINMEEINSNGDISSSNGTISRFDTPSGPGIRVDSYGYPGYVTNQNFDSLLAKLICYSRTSTYGDVVSKAYRALCEFRIEGVNTTIPLLQNLLSHPAVAANKVSTSFVEENIEGLIGPDTINHKRLFFDTSDTMNRETTVHKTVKDLLRLAPENTQPVVAHTTGVVVTVAVAENDPVHESMTVAVLESMKMQHTVKAGVSGVVRLVIAGQGDSLNEGQPLLFIEPGEIDASERGEKAVVDPDAIRPDLKEVIERTRLVLDEARPKAVAKRRKTGQRTARENIVDLVDSGSFIEYGTLTVAAQRSRMSMEQLIEKSPADGLVAGMATVNSALFDSSRARCIVMSYDYTAMAGTQGFFNHKKTDRMLHLAEKWRLPLVLFAEGGGGRPGDVDALQLMVAGLDLSTFREYAKLSGLVPLVGIVSGRCYAGNAALLGCSDVIIATKNSCIGMGGPAMIEGGGLGACKPEDIGPIHIQSPNGVVDIVVEDEQEAVQAVRQYLSYFQGPVSEWECPDQRLLRHTIPEDRKRVYDIRKVIDILADTGSVLELRRDFGVGIISAFVRIEGVPFGLTANNPMHLGGAIDADAADKAARFLQLCDAFDIPLITLSDTPGFMVGPEAEKTAQVRHFSRMFVAAAGSSIPIFSIVLRKGYGLGAMAMVGGSYHDPVFNVSWPTGEFGGMGLEGAVRLAFKKDLEAQEDPEKRQALFESFVAMAYAHGKATNMAAFLEIDGVIDPVETRSWIMRGIKSVPAPEKRTKKKRPHIDTW